MTKNDIWVVYSTFPNAEEAFFMAGMLLEKRLIACANVHEHATSLYRWQGGIQREKEVVMMAKTTQARVKECVATIAENHSYQIPAVTAFAATEGFAPYQQWIADETSQAA